MRIKSDLVDSFWIKFKMFSAMVSKIRKYLFIGTTFAEFINAAFVIGFGLVFFHDLLDGVNNIAALDSYLDFKSINIWKWSGFILLGVLQLISLAVPSFRSTKIGGFLLIVSSAMWAFVAGTFITSRGGVITTAPIIYGVWSFATFVAGIERFSICRKIEGKINKGE